jgi:heterodisulfide reductase subunit A
MKVGVYFCNCGTADSGQVSSKMDARKAVARIGAIPEVAYVDVVDFACSDATQDQIVAHLAEQRPERVVIAACSPRQHEETFRSVLARAGMNPYLMQLVNIREQVAWVTEDPEAALEKAVAQIGAGVARVQHQEPLEATELDVCSDLLVIGGGPAGLKAALTAAEAGRRVTLVEKGPILGGLPVRFEEIFPAMECAPCLLEPVLGDILHGRTADLIEVLLSSEVVSLKGSLGNFEARVRRSPRYVSVNDCVGCGECIEACPVSVPNPLALGRTERKAIDFELFGGLPSVPVLDVGACHRFTQGSACSLCLDSCPVEGAVLYEETETFVDRKIGAVVLAVGASLYDLSKMPNLGYGQHPDVLSSWEVERMLAANGPSGGQLVCSDGRAPATVAIIHCVGSLEPDYVPYCSGICCQSAFKYVHQIEQAQPETKFVELYKTIVAPGKDAFPIYQSAAANPNVRWVQYNRVADLDVRAGAEQSLMVTHRGDTSLAEELPVDLVVLMAPVVPAEGTRRLAEVLEIGLGPLGFFEELNARSDATRSNVRGIYIAGTCQGPMDIQGAMTQGAAASGNALAAVVDGRKLVTEAVTAFVDELRCSGCRTCIPVCPYKAIDFDSDSKVAVVNRALCAGCGTCVAACPAGAMQGHHFTQAAIIAEIEAVLA